jgi:hypothetical protein
MLTDAAIQFLEIIHQVFPELLGIFPGLIEVTPFASEWSHQPERRFSDFAHGLLDRWVLHAGREDGGEGEGILPFPPPPVKLLLSLSTPENV